MAVFSGKPIASLAAVTSTGVGTAVQLQQVMRTCAMQTKTTGGPASVSVTLEGSLDGTNYVTLATSTSTSGDLQVSVDKPTFWIRANLGTLTGGTAPTVTATIAATP